MSRRRHLTLHASRVSRHSFPPHLDVTAIVPVFCTWTYLRPCDDSIRRYNRYIHQPPATGHRRPGHAEAAVRCGLAAAPSAPYLLSQLRSVTADDPQDQSPKRGLDGSDRQLRDLQVSSGRGGGGGGGTGRRRRRRRCLHVFGALSKRARMHTRRRVGCGCCVCAASARFFYSCARLLVR